MSSQKKQKETVMSCQSTQFSWSGSNLKPVQTNKAEMNSPMDDAFEKLKQRGPPQWFVEAMT